MFSFEPRCQGFGVAEVDRQAGLDRKAPVLCHLRALVPGERAAKLGRQRGDARLERIRDLDGAGPLGQGDELAVARGALDQGRDRVRPSAHQEVSLPVAGDRWSSTSGGRSEIITIPAICPGPGL